MISNSGRPHDGKINIFDQIYLAMFLYSWLSIIYTVKCSKCTRIVVQSNNKNADMSKNIFF